MKCALCLNAGKLCGSHIIPEFLYRTLYDKKHRFHQISADPGKNSTYLQRGIRQFLLCESCEQRFSVYERYASQFLNGGVGIGIQQHEDRLYLSHLDYANLKLFQLSILWRAGVSTLPAFSQVTLGAHEDRIRTMLLHNDPGRSDDYGCLMFALMLDQDHVQGLIVQPTWARLAGAKAYRFVFGGLIFVYVVSSTPPPLLSPYYLQSNGMAVVKLEELRNLEFLMRALTNMARLGKFDNRSV